MIQPSVMTHSIGLDDTIILARHYDGSGSVTLYTEIYVLRSNKFLGRFNFDEKKELVWLPSSDHKVPASDGEIKKLTSHAKAMQNMAEKLYARVPI